MAVPSPSALRLVNSLTRLSRIVTFSPPLTPQPLAGFNIYRNNADTFQGAVKLTPTPIHVPFFVDQVEERIESFTFYYFVTAVDQTNAESAPAGPVNQEFTPFNPHPAKSAVFSIRKAGDEMRRRHGKILTFDGETMHYLARKVAGTLAVDYDPNRRDAPYRSAPSMAGSPVGAYGTRFQGGYDLLPNVQIRYIPTTMKLSREEMGLTAERVPTCWVVDFPILQPRDIIIRANNERYKIVKVRPQSLGGKVTRQVAELEYLEPSDIIYSYPVPTFVNPAAPIDASPQFPIISNPPPLPGKSAT